MNLIEILGFTAAALTTAANVPQAIKIIKTRSTKSISSLTYIILLSGLLLWVAYGIYTHDFPIIIANTVSAAITGVILAMKLIAKKEKKEH